MSKITDLGSPDRELSAGDIKRKKNKLRRTEERLEKAPAGTRQRHRLEFKKLKTEDQIKTGMSGIRPVKKPFKISHHADLKQDKKFNAPVNMIGDPKVKKSTVTPPPPTQKEQDLMRETWSKTYKSIKEQKYPGAVGVDLGTIKSKNPVDRLDKDGLISSAEGAKSGAYRKSALNMLGITPKSPLNNGDLDFDVDYSGAKAVDLGPIKPTERGKKIAKIKKDVRDPGLEREHDYFVKHPTEKSDKMAVKIQDQKDITAKTKNKSVSLKKENKLQEKLTRLMNKAERKRNI